MVANGRYGPYVKKGAETRSLDVRGAAVHAHRRGGAGAARAAEAAARPRRGEAAAEGARPRSRSRGKPIVVKDGRFGPYVTDGETNASLRRGDDVESLTLERALELLAERRAKGPSEPRVERKKRSHMSARTCVAAAKRRLFALRIPLAVAMRASVC